MLWITGSLFVGLSLPVDCTFAVRDCVLARAAAVIGFLAGVGYGVLYLFTSCQ
jgi:hypothetical protein